MLSTAVHASVLQPNAAHSLVRRSVATTPLTTIVGSTPATASWGAPNSSPRPERYGQRERDGRERAHAREPALSPAGSPGFSPILKRPLRRVHAGQSPTIPSHALKPLRGRVPAVIVVFERCGRRSLPIGQGLPKLCRRVRNTLRIEFILASPTLSLNREFTRATSSDEPPILDEGPRPPLEYATEAALPPNIAPVVTSRSMNRATATTAPLTEAGIAPSSSLSSPPPVASAHADASDAAAAAAAAAAATAASAVLTPALDALGALREGQAMRSPLAGSLPERRGDDEGAPELAIALPRLAPPPLPPSSTASRRRAHRGSSATSVHEMDALHRAGCHRVFYCFLHPPIGPPRWAHPNRVSIRMSSVR